MKRSCLLFLFVLWPLFAGPLAPASSSPLQGIYRFQSETGAEWLIAPGRVGSAPSINIICLRSCAGWLSSQAMEPVEYQGKLQQAGLVWNVELSRLNGTTIPTIRARLELKNPQLIVLASRKSMPLMRSGLWELSYHAMPGFAPQQMVFSAGASGPHLILFRKNHTVYGWLLDEDQGAYSEWSLWRESIRLHVPGKGEPAIEPGLLWGAEGIYTLVSPQGEEMVLGIDIVRTPVTDVSGFLERRASRRIRLTQANDSNSETLTSCLDGTCDWLFSTLEAIWIFQPGLRRGYRLARDEKSGKWETVGPIKDIESSPAGKTVTWSDGRKQQFYLDRVRGE